ncbi:MAG: chromosome partitioning protein [Flavobacteriaceae bacterium]|nr:MAG: chromosome partitioning protein [Flavobacteriaceae bacterium]
MALQKLEVQQLLEELELTPMVKNIQIFDNEVQLDLEVKSPALHQKKKFEEAISQAFQDKFGPEVSTKLHFVVEAKESLPPIAGKAIPGVKHIIAISSGKGGVGKSTVTSNLAVSLQKMGFKVGVLDADIHGPSMPIMFDIEDQKPRQIHIEGKSKMQPIESYGIKILSIGFFTDANQAIVWRGPMAGKALHQMIHDAHWGELDFLLLDLPPGTGDIHLSLVQQIPITATVIVSTPQNVAMADVKRGVNMFSLDSINVPILGIIENMAYFTPLELPQNKYYIFGESGAKHMAGQLNIPFLGEIPLVQGIRESSDVGRPICLQEENPVTLAYHQITQNMIESLGKRNKNLPPTEVVRITTMAGCSPKK